ncbi:MAG: hypothetical protein RLZZ553_298 [Verrucomicrobiota bacterium]|jgi:hypothetical protein
MSFAMKIFPRIMNITVPRRFFYDVAILFMLALSTRITLIVWRAESKRIYSDGKFLGINIYETERPMEFSAMKSGAWQQMSFLVTMTVLMLIFRREGHSFLGDE